MNGGDKFFYSNHLNPCHEYFGLILILLEKVIHYKIIWYKEFMDLGFLFCLKKEQIKISLFHIDIKYKKIKI